MKLAVFAIGQRQPGWADAAWAEYVRRLPAEWRFELRELKAEPRSGRTTAQCLAAEAARFEAAVGRGWHRVVLDERGDRATTAQLAARLQRWQAGGRDVALLVGGPDGLDASVKAGADETLRLSDLTLPHALARVLLAEALYRAASLNAGHPYHRE
jgi:23S rRNA (pseudouridine1915-N3)-methyltransferase